jgi:hypothetical protein
MVTAATIESDQDDAPPRVNPDSVLGRALARVAEAAQRPDEVLAAFNNYV